MAGIDLANRLAIGAVINGLREGGEVSERTMSAIAAAFRGATAITDEMGHSDTSVQLRKLADVAENGGTGK